MEIQVSCQYHRAFVQVCSLTLLFSVALFHFLYIYSIKKSEQKEQNSVTNVYGMTTGARTQSPKFWVIVKKPSPGSLEKKNLLSSGAWG